MFVWICLLVVAAFIAGDRLGQRRERRKHKALQNGQGLLPAATALTTVELRSSPPALLPQARAETPELLAIVNAIREYYARVVERRFRADDKAFLEYPLQARLKDAALTATQAGLTDEAVAACECAERELAIAWIRWYYDNVMRDCFSVDEETVVTLDRRLEQARLTATDARLTKNDVEACRHREKVRLVKYELHQMRQQARMGGYGSSYFRRRHLHNAQELMREHGVTPADLPMSDDAFRRLVIQNK